MLNAPKKIQLFNAKWNEFLSCCLWHFTVPFLPIFLEYIFTGKISDSNLFIFISIYSLSISVSSKNQVIGSFCIFASIIFSSFYGFISKDPELHIDLIYLIIVLVLIIVPHLIERYNRHYVEQEAFLKWDLQKSDTNGG